MGIEKVDKNFIIQYSEGMDSTKKDYYRIPSEPFDLYGIEYDYARERFSRIDYNLAESVNENIAYLSVHTAGGRLRFSTDSNSLELVVRYQEFAPMAHIPCTGSSGFMLLEERENGCTIAAQFAPQVNNKDGYILNRVLPGSGMQNYILHFPLYNEVLDLTIGVEKGAKVGHGKKYRDTKPILYYGSSITQGGCASRPDNAYQGLIAKWNNIDFINWGMSGSAQAEDPIVDALAKFDVSLFVCDYDHNAPDVEYLKKTHFRLYERYRAANPETPILFISKPDYRYDREDDEARFAVIQQTYRKAKRRGDKNVYLLRGKDLFGDVDRENCMVDGCHPNDLGFYRMAKKIYQKMKQIDKKFE
ncbi:MAG: hypothetical protein IKA88_03470 [Clostridia bacterium]|nr:hypothetical protein [Clostridia bacterium]